MLKLATILAAATMLRRSPFRSSWWRTPSKNSQRAGEGRERRELGLVVSVLRRRGVDKPKLPLEPGEDDVLALDGIGEVGRHDEELRVFRLVNVSGIRMADEEPAQSLSFEWERYAKGPIGRFTARPLRSECTRADRILEPASRGRT